MDMTDPRWLDEGEARAWRGFLRMSWLLEAALARDLARRAQLSPADYYVLARLSETPEARLRMSDLAAGIQWSKSRLSHQIGRMEARGLVARVSCPSDARGTFAALTPAGRAAIEAAAPSHVETIRRHLLERLTPEQVEALAEISEAVIAALPDCPGTDEAEECAAVETGCLSGSIGLGSGACAEAGPV